MCTAARLRLWAVVSVFYLMAFPARSHAESCSSSNQGAFIFLINGIWTSYSDVEIDRLEFKDRLEESLGCTIPVLPAYNTSVGVGDDLYEAAAQAGLIPFGGDDLFWFTIRGFQDVAASKYGALALHLGEFISNEIQEAFLALDGQPTTQMEADIQLHLATFEPVFTAGRRVILVGHSQGNFFANIEYSRILSQSVARANKTSVVSVATPEDYIAADPAGARFTNFRGDFIRLLSNLGWNIPDPSGSKPPLHNDNCGANIPFDLDCHALATYMAEEAAWNKISGDLQSLVLPPAPTVLTATDDGPYQIVQGGTLTVPSPGNSNLLDNDAIPSGATAIFVDFELDPEVYPPPPGSLINLTNSGAPGGFIYQPPASFSGIVTLHYFVGTGNFGNSNIATVTVNVQAPPPAPPPPPVVSPGPYSIRLLDDQSIGIENSRALAIDSYGAVTGVVSSTSDANYNGCGSLTSQKPFMWTSAHGMKVLAPYPLATPCGGAAVGVNDRGDVVGYLDYGFAGGTRAFIWSEATGMQLVASLSASSASDINNLRQVVGTTAGSAFRWSSLDGLELLQIPAQNTGAFAINEVGDIAGHAGVFTCPGTARPVIWDTAGQHADIDVSGLGTTLPEGHITCFGRALAINDNQVVVGQVRVHTTVPSELAGTFAFLSRDNVAQWLGELPFTAASPTRLTAAYGISNSDHVVGESNGRAFVWTPEKGILDLNSLLDESGIGWTVISATAINEVGQIAGYGIYGGITRAFLLTPTYLTDPGWVTYQHDAQHTGRSPFLGPQANTLAWSYAFGLEDSSSAVSVSQDGRIYSAPESPANTHLWKLRVVNSDGSLAFESPQFSGRAGSVSTITNDGTVYIGTRTTSGQDHHLYAFNADGTVRWTKPLARFGGSVTVASDGTVFVPAGEPGFFAPEPGAFTGLAALRPDGSTVWEYVGRRSTHPPAIASNGSVIASGFDNANCNFVAAHQTATGALLWQRTACDLFNSTITPPAIGSDGSIFVVRMGSAVAFSSNGTERWATPLNAVSASTPAIALDGTILVAIPRNATLGVSLARLVKLSPHTGEIIQEVTLPGSDATPEGTAQVAVDADGTAYVSLPSSSSCSPSCPRLFAVAADGTIKWLRSSAMTEEAVIGDVQTIYVVELENNGEPLIRLQKISTLPVPE